MMDIRDCPDCEGPLKRIDGRIYPHGEKHVVIYCPRCFYRTVWIVPIDFDIFERKKVIIP